MKLLILGIDGADSKIMNHFQLNTWRKLCESLTDHDVRLKDLWSRGWGELLSGKHGSQTGALYARPTTTPGVTNSKFTSSDYSKSSVPLWEKLNSRGLSVSLHNIPTTMPAPTLDGYVVCGGGAGMSADPGVENSLFYPKRGVVPQTIGNNYIRDIRYSTLKNRSFDNLFKQLDLMDSNHIDTFCSLNLENRIDVGFLVIRSLVVVQQLFVDIIDNPSIDMAIYERIRNHFNKLDIKMGRLIDSLSPENIVVVSDHGQSTKKHSVNLNAIFNSTKKPPIRAASENIISQIKKTTPSAIKKILKQNSSIANLDKKFIPSLNPKAKVFANRYIPGVYVNSNSLDEQDELSAMIIERINSNQILTNLGIHATISERVYPHELYPLRTFIPSVVIDQPEDVFFESLGPLHKPNQHLNQLRRPDDISSDQHVGGKGYTPVAMTNFDFTLDKSKRSLSDFINAVLEKL